ncbi:hypothetical protein AGMMS49940_18720 [Spirochaetia bacterium]|nr:hypothetical protein AGMMS49940_18720 [Spirochaetia bacterium]
MGAKVSKPFFKGGGFLGGGVSVGANGAIFTMTGGTISENRATSAGAGINTAGTTTIAGGHIENNHGIGVRLQAGSLTMSAGYITGNETASTNFQAGSGVFIFAGTFTMTGGEISGNRDMGTGGFGGGIHNYNGTADIQGGTISKIRVNPDSSPDSNSKFEYCVNSTAYGILSE